jgi:hypothetical protein
MASPAAVFRSFRCWRVPPVEVGFRDAYTDALVDHAFRPALSPGKKPRHGWVAFDRPLHVDFVPDDWVFNDIAAFAIRTEQRRIPTGLLRARIDDAARSWCSEHQQRERCPARVRAELREAIENDLIAQCLPTFRTRPVIWNLVEGWLVFGASSEAMCNVFQKLFHRTFGLTPEPEEVDDVPGCIRFTDPAADFLTWLLWRDQQTFETGDQEVAAWLEGPVKIGGMTARTVASAVLAALASGEAPSALTLCVRHGDREYRVKLDGDRVAGIKLPGVVNRDPAESVAEAAFLYEDAVTAVATLKARFAVERGRADAQYRAGLDRWLGAGLDPIAAFLEKLRAST